MSRLIFFVLLSGVCLGSVLVVAHVRMETVSLGYKIEELTERQATLRQQERLARLTVATLRAPAALVSQNERLGLGLVGPEGWDDPAGGQGRRQSGAKSTLARQSPISGERSRR